MTDTLQPERTTQQPAAAIDALGLAKAAFDTSTNYFDSSIRRQVEAAIRQFQGVHPTGSKYHSDAYRTRSRLFRPKTRGTIRKNEAVGSEALFSTRDVVSIEAEDDNNPMQLGAAKLMKYLMNFRLKKSIPWFITCIGAYQDAQVTGVCISYNYWEYKPAKGIDRPCVQLLPIENFRFDPAADWTDPVNTSPYNIRLIPMYVKDVRARMKRAPNSGKKQWKEMSDSQLLAAKNAYTDTTRATRERGRQDSTSQSTSVTDFDVVWVHENVMEIDGEDMVWFTLSTIGVLTDPVPLKQEYWHGKRPFTMGFCVLETHKTYVDGVAGITKDVQAEINDVANLRIDNVKFAMNKRYFARRASQVDIRSLTRNVPGSVTLMNDVEKDVKINETQDVTSSAYQEQDRLNVDFDEVSGAFSPASIQSNRKLNETVGGLTLLSTSSNQVGAYQLKTFVETWVEPTLSQVMLLEAYYEDDQRLLKLAGKQAKLMDDFGIEAITDELMQQELTLTVEVGQGATNPQEKVNNFMLGLRALKEILVDGTLEKYGLDVQDVVTEIFSHLGYRDGGRFFDRAEDPNIAALQAQVQDLMQQLAQKEHPDLVAAKVANFDAKTRDLLASALEKALKSIFAAHQTGQMIAAVPAIAPVADSVLDAGARMSGNQPTADQPFMAPAQPLPGITQEEVGDPRTGIKFMPGQPGAGDTSPSTPASPAVGANAGMTTMRADS